MSPRKSASAMHGSAWDEFVGEGEAREASVFDLTSSRDRWQARIATSRRTSSSLDLALPAFALIRGGDFFERPKKAAGRATRDDSGLVEAWSVERLRLDRHGVSTELADLAVAGVCRVLRGNPAICRRMLLVKPIRVVLVPSRRDFRSFGFPRHTNPNSAGIFWNRPADEEALIGLREEYVGSKSWLMIHEMTHAVHLLALTTREREDIDRFLMPVYRSRMWVEEAVAIYAERAFGAEYGPEDLDAPGLYGKTRRDWDPQHVFSLFMRELLRPSGSIHPSRPRRG